MNGVAWVVEIWDTAGWWVPVAMWHSRKRARYDARSWETKTRVRKYIRQPEVRP